MSELTPNLKLFKYDTLIDGKEVFSIDKAMNDNWNKIDSGTVRKTGDTMSGNLIIEKNSSGDIYLDNTTADYTSTTTPSSNLNIGRIMMRDKNNAYTGVFQSLLNTGGNMCTEMVCRRSIGGTNKTGTIAVRIGNTGTIHTYAPACSNTNSILTTQAIAKQTPGYVLLGNGLQICWGNQTIYKAGTTITFPRAFNTSVRLVILQCNYGTTELGAVGAFETNTGTWTKTGFKANCNVEYCGTTWIALGY